MQDVFRRVLETSGQKTFHVRNLTDVDDKTIRQSQEQGAKLEDFTEKWENPMVDSSYDFDTGTLTINVLP